VADSDGEEYLHVELDVALAAAAQQIGCKKIFFLYWALKGNGSVPVPY